MSSHKELTFLIMSYILNIETSGKACTVAIGHGLDVASTVEAEGDFRHSKDITLMIQKALSEASITINQLAAIAVSKGPGSYTGLRVGATCAKGICYALDIPLLSVDTLQAMAAPYSDLYNDKDETTLDCIIPMIDARRMEVYYAVYDKSLNPIEPANNLVLDESSFTSYIAKNLLFCGDGAQKFQELADILEKDVTVSYAQAKYMVKIAYAKYQQKNYEDLAYYVPFYLKPPNITKSKKKYW